LGDDDGPKPSALVGKKINIFLGSHQESFWFNAIDQCPSINAGHSNQDTPLEHYKGFVQKWWVLVRGKTAKGFLPQAEQLYVEDGNPWRTPHQAQRCQFWMHTN
jgi:hypothetical protein